MSKNLSAWEHHVCCAPRGLRGREEVSEWEREEVSDPVIMTPMITSDKMPAHRTWEMLEHRYAQLLEHHYAQRALSLDVADGRAVHSAHKGSLPVRCMSRDDGVAARNKSRLSSYHMLVECRRAVREMHTLKAERETLREQKKEGLPSIFLTPLPKIEDAPDADVHAGVYSCFVPLPGMQSQHLSVSLASGAGEACLVAAQVGRISSGYHGREEMEARLLGVCLYPLRR